MINLLVEFYESKFDNRNRELQEAFTKNIDCETIDNIFVFASNELKFDKNSKVNHVVTTDRMQFRDYFQFANLLSGTCIVANADIYFDDSLESINYLNEQDFLCISRWNDGELQGQAAYSQDVWVFKQKISDDMINESNFFLGTQQCDNRIAFLAVKHGFNVSNPCHLIKCHHLHKDADQITYDKKHKIPNALHLTTVDPCGIMEYDDINVCSHWPLGDGSRMCGKEYIEFCRGI